MLTTVVVAGGNWKGWTLQVDQCN